MARLQIDDTQFAEVDEGFADALRLLVATHGLGRLKDTSAFIHTGGKSGNAAKAGLAVAIDLEFPPAPRG
jgi:hypothetical protein